MSKDDVTQLVHRDSLTKNSRANNDSIPSAWAAPAEAATGLPTDVDGGSKTPLIIAVVVIAVVALGGLYWFNRPPEGQGPVATTPPLTPPTGAQVGGEKVAKAPNIAMGTAPNNEKLVPAPLPESAPPPLPEATPPPTPTENPADSTNAEAAAKAEAVAAAKKVEDAKQAAADLAAKTKKVRRYNQRAELAIKRAKYKTAELLLNQAIALDATYPPLHRNLGVARARRKNVAGARTAYEEYIRLAPQAPDAPDVRRILGQ